MHRIQWSKQELLLPRGGHAQPDLEAAATRQHHVSAGRRDVHSILRLHAKRRCHPRLHHVGLRSGVQEELIRSMPVEVNPLHDRAP